MTIRLDHSVYVHVPRCAGQWFGRVLGACGLERQTLHAGPLPWRQLPASWQDLKAFAFVRHPLAWAASRWAAASDDRSLTKFLNSRGTDSLFDDLVMPRLADTLRRVMDKRPGLVGATFSELTHGPVRLARVEDLPGAAVRLLTELEPGCDLLPGVAVLPANGASGLPKYRAEIDALDAGLAEEFLRSEEHALEMWEGANG